MEVLFAMGVLMIGLLGLAAVLPAGINQSADALRADTTAAVMENLVATTVAQLSSGHREFLVPDTTAAYGQQQYNKLFLSGPVCVDPWFLSAANNERPAAGNGYDRSKFPCYHGRYNPLVSPSEELVAGIQWCEGLVNGPRMQRVAPFPGNGVASKVRGNIARAMAVQTLDHSLLLPDDKSIPPGIMIGGSESGFATSPMHEGRFSAFSIIQPYAADSGALRVTVAVTEARSNVINFVSDDTATAGNDERFPLQPYVYNETTDPNYEGERLAYVTVAPDGGRFTDGFGGEVTIAASSLVSSELKVGQWVMFARQRYQLNATLTAVMPPTVANQFGLPLFEWYKIEEIVSEPSYGTYADPVHGTDRDVWAATLRLSGPDWIFDDNVAVTATGIYDASTAYDGTFVVLMPEVVAVFDRTVLLEM